MRDAGDVARFKVPPVHKSLEVVWRPERAFDRFCQIGNWWPTATHSLGGAQADTRVAFERLEVGARLVERWRSGEVHVWGTITKFERPAVLSFTWHVGRDEDAAQLVELTFRATDAGTMVELVHSGWERLGEKAAELRDNYDNGWESVLERYANDAGAKS